MLLRLEYLYYILIISNMIISIVRFQRIYLFRVGTALLIAYTSTPFLWLVVMAIREAALFHSLIAFSSSAFWLILSLCLPLALLLESKFLRGARDLGVKSQDRGN
jgi:hypothetical protein